jgi:hypothetical protein
MKIDFFLFAHQKEYKQKKVGSKRKEELAADGKFTFFCLFMLSIRYDDYYLYVFQVIFYFRTFTFSLTALDLIFVCCTLHHVHDGTT